MWRPEEWGGIKAHIFYEATGNVRTKAYNDLIEATADAMLEALKEKMTFYNIYNKDWYINRTGGTWVFIPDDEVKDALLP